MVNIGENLTSKKTSAPSFIMQSKAAKVSAQSDVFKVKEPFEFKYLKEVTTPKSREDVAVLTQTNPSQINRLIKYEGFYNKMYRDPAGVWTVGVGHNVSADKNYHFGKNITNSQVYTLLVSDLKQVKKDVNNTLAPVRLNSNQSEAVTDLFFNVGASKLKDSNLVHSIKNKKFEDAACEFNYISSNHVVFPGLCQRRIEDINTFCSGKYTPKILNSVKFIYNKGIEAFDKSIKRAHSVNKARLKDQKALYQKCVNQVIQQAQKSMVSCAPAY